MDIVCKGCNVRLRIPDTHITGNRLKVRCKKCGSPIILLGALDNVQALGATVLPQTQQSQPQRAPTTVQRIAASAASPEPSVRHRPTVRESVRSDQTKTKPSRAFEGARNENSVLFTLSNLKDVAKKRQAVAAEKAKARDGYASGEGSGYIDIRALVSLSRQNASTVDKEETNTTEMDAFERTEPTVPTQTELPGTTFENTIGTVSLAPVTLESESPNKALPIAIVAGGAMLAAGVVISLNLIDQDEPNRLATAGASIVRFINTNLFETGIDTDSVEPSIRTVPLQENVAVEPQVQPAPVVEPAIAKPEVEQPVVTPAREDAKNEEQTTSVRLPAKRPNALKKAVATKSIGRTRAISAALAKPGPILEKARVETEEKARVETEKKARVETEEKAKGYSIDDILAGDIKDKKTEAETKPSEPPETDPLLDPIPAKKPPQGDQSVDDLLDRALAKGDKPKAEPATPEPDATPETPSRQQVIKAIKKIAPAAKACAASSNESAVAKLTIVVTGSSGQVTRVQADGIEEPIRSCVVQQVMKAQFPVFAKPELSINYPLKL